MVTMHALGDEPAAPVGRKWEAEGGQGQGHGQGGALRGLEVEGGSSEASVGTRDGLEGHAKVATVPAGVDGGLQWGTTSATVTCGTWRVVRARRATVAWGLSARLGWAVWPCEVGSGREKGIGPSDKG